MIAALYVEKDGAYFGLPDVDPWDEERDARLYAGPWPVVAHPPCNRWSRMATIHPVARHLLGQDGGTFAAALASVRSFGGVLEHPAQSRAWDEYGLPVPTGTAWSQSLLDPGWVCVVDQAAYGHMASKPTWLYYIGAPPPPLSTARPLTDRNVRNLSKKQRMRSPLPFRDVLLSLAGQEGKP